MNDIFPWSEDTQYVIITDILRTSDFKHPPTFVHIEVSISFLSCILVYYI